MLASTYPVADYARTLSEPDRGRFAAFVLRAARSATGCCLAAVSRWDENSRRLVRNAS